MSQESVRKLIPFTEKDLEANRRLEVTDAQINRLRSDIQKIFTWAAVGLIGSTVVFFVLGAMGQLAVMLPRNLNKPDQPKLLIGFIALVAVVFVVCFFMNFWCWIQFRNYDEKRTVLVTEGKAERFQDGETNVIRVGSVEFYLEDELYAAFTDVYYRIYYLDTKDIISVETPEPKI